MTTSDASTSDASTSDASTSETSPDDTHSRYELDETGFNEVPKKWRKFYRHWGGPTDKLARNEVICPVCKIVIRSARELQPGDKLYCMPCMSRMVVKEGPDGHLFAEVIF